MSCPGHVYITVERFVYKLLKKISEKITDYVGVLNQNSLI